MKIQFFTLLSALNSPWLMAESELIDLTPKRFTQMDQGGVGLLQTPTARMAPEGDLSINYADIEQYRFWSVNLQLFPWMQATARYADVRTNLYSPFPNFSGDQTYKDKGLDVKFRLLQESYYLPELSVGFRDFGGTGLFTSEFVAASKRWGDFDFHLGIGWGHLGTEDNIKNPFCEIADRFCNRPTALSGRGGKIDYQKFFKGPAAIFGGIEYQTPWDPLSIKVEYEGNDYSRDRATGIVQDSNWNIGANYRWKDLIFGLSYQRGNTLGFNLSYNFNLHKIRRNKVDVEPVSLNKPAPQSEHSYNTMMRIELDQYAGFSPTKFYQQDNTLTVFGRQTSYEDNNEAVNRTARVLASRTDDSVDTYKIIDVSGSLPLVETTVDANKFKAYAKQLDPTIEITDTYSRGDISQQTLVETPESSGFGFGTNIKGFWTQSLGNPEAFYMYQGGALVSGYISMPNHFSLTATAKVTLLENFNKFNFKVDSENTPLPRVRTYVREYVTRSDVTLNNLYLNWTDRLAPNLYATAYGGYLESMFGGVGGEILYRPVDSNFAIGADINYVKQRDYASDWDFFDYEAPTGHVNIYYQPQFLENSMLTFNVGQYLAKDKGVTVDFAKRFDSGITIGAWAAFTDVSAEEYGEGSFSKGFYINIPFDIFSVKPSRGAGSIPWIPIGRDGGQALRRPTRLIDVTAERSFTY